MATQYMNMEDIFCLSEDRRCLIETLAQWGLLAKEGVLTCPRCGGFMRLIGDASREDQFSWACLNKVSINKKKAAKCGKSLALRKNTFFENANLSLQQILIFCHLWVHNSELQFITLETRISKLTAVKWNFYCYEVVIDFGLRQQKPIGGENMTVEIGESKFGTRKSRSGDHVEEQWVFGGVCRETGDVFLVPVASRDASTLTPLIIKWIMPGSTIISDCSVAYDGLDEASYRILKVNNSVDSKDPAHNNTIRGLWRHVKCKLPEYNRRESLFGGYLAKFLFSHYCKVNKLDPTLEFFKAAAELYNPNKVGESSTAVEENQNIQNTEEGESSTIKMENEKCQDSDEESSDDNEWDLYA